MRREEDNFGWHNIMAIGTTRENQLNLSRKRREEAGEVCGANELAMEQKHTVREWHAPIDGHT